MHIEEHHFLVDGWVPNNPYYPLLHYKKLPIRGMPLGEPNASAKFVVAHFAKNGWVSGWVDGIYPFQHYHSTAHEVLANIADAVDVQFGGQYGPIVSFGTGDVVVIPAGVGHCRKSSPRNLSIIGAYPAGQGCDLKRATRSDFASAQQAISKVPRPSMDPVTGLSAPLNAHWSG
ncbi:MAG: cupin [Hyphomicrobiaceae bacterium]